MGLLGDLLASKGTVEAKVTITGIPSSARTLYKLCFVPARSSGAPPPRAPGPDARWTGYQQDYVCAKRLPVGSYQVMIVIMPVLAGKDGTHRKDRNLEVPFWPVPEAFDVRKGQTTKVRIDVDFPRAGLG